MPKLPKECNDNRRRMKRPSNKEAKKPESNKPDNKRATHG